MLTHSLSIQPRQRNMKCLGFSRNSSMLKNMFGLSSALAFQYTLRQGPLLPRLALTRSSRENRPCPSRPGHAQPGWSSGSVSPQSSMVLSAMRVKGRLWPHFVPLAQLNRAVPLAGSRSLFAAASIFKVACQVSKSNPVRIRMPSEKLKPRHTL